MFVTNFPITPDSGAARPILKQFFCTYIHSFIESVDFAESFLPSFPYSIFILLSVMKCSSTNVDVFFSSPTIWNDGDERLSELKLIVSLNINQHTLYIVNLQKNGATNLTVIYLLKVPTASMKYQKMASPSSYNDFCWFFSFNHNRKIS